MAAAADTDNIPETIVNLVDAVSATFIVNTFNDLWGVLSVSFRNLLILFLIFYGLAIWRGLIKTPVQDLAWTALKFAVIYGLIRFWPLYNEFVVVFFTQTPDALAGAVFSEQTGNTATAALGEVYLQSIASSAIAYESNGIIMPFVLGSIILLSATLMLIYGLFLVALAKIALAVMIGLGPLFLIFMMFKPTQKIFEAWLQQIVQYMFVILLTVGVLAIGGELATNAVGLIPGEAGDITLGTIMPSTVVFLVIFLLLTQVLTMASALAGGIALTTQHIGAIVGYKAAQSFSSVGRGTWQELKTRGKKGWRHIQDRRGRGVITRN